MQVAFGCLAPNSSSIAAVIIALIALAPIWQTCAVVDFYLHDTYFVVPWRHAILAFALLGGLFGGFYYLADRVLAHRLNTGLALAHFLFWVFSPIVLALAAEGLSRRVQAGQAPNQSWLLLMGLVPALSFIVGGALFLVNLVWAIVMNVKTS